MSFLRALPSLRSSVAHRAWTASFSSSARACASASSSSQSPDLTEFLETSQDIVPETDLSSADIPPAQAAAETAIVDDGPPRPSDDSYPANPAAAAVKAAKAEVGITKALYAVSVKATRNNTIITFARPNGNQLVTLTGGKLGFKKSNRNGYEAGYQCAVGVIAAMEAELQRTDYEWQLFLKGFGAGREAMLTAVTTSVGAKVKDRLKRVTDRTPIKIGGTRGQKTRRI
ncbi:translational machinery component [Cubamyces sp. BRFM 1775]|nr:translational machinery component [Cubamyces sp. BRFM 1775]